MIIDPENFTPEQQAEVIVMGLERMVERAYDLHRRHSEAFRLHYKKLSAAMNEIGVIVGDLMAVETEYNRLRTLYERGKV